MKSIAINKKKKIKATKARLSPLTIFMLIVLIIYTLSLFGLMLYGLMTAFKCGMVGTLEYRLEYMPGNPYGLPKTWYWNFSFVIKNFIVQATDPMGISPAVKVGIVKMFGNSILYSLGCSFFHTFVMCTTAYCCARFPYRYSKIIHTIVIVVMIIPIVGNAPSELSMAIRLGIYNKIWGMWIMRANFLGMYFLVFYDIFKAVPASYTEAAKIDGANNWSIFFRIILPLVKNTFLTVLLINFIQMWNDYQIPMLYLPSFPTVAYGLFGAVNSTVKGLETTPMRLAAAIIMLLPILVVFICTQKRLLGNLTMGGVKG
ncbi:MAG: carbohydrate ABC transporter permease [Clostridia bacterium]|nr:carbohydrate ABC transporter permease [Clostridia bacterium]